MSVGNTKFIRRKISTYFHHFLTILSHYVFGKGNQMYPRSFIRTGQIGEQKAMYLWVLKRRRFPESLF